MQCRYCQTSDDVDLKIIAYTRHKRPICDRCQAIHEFAFMCRRAAALYQAEEPSAASGWLCRARGYAEASPQLGPCHEHWAWTCGLVARSKIGTCNPS